MKILLDILHPAHVHFFRNAVEELTGKGHEVLVTARDKDLTLRLLDLYGIPHRVISREASGKAGLAGELATRNIRLARLVVKEKPSVLGSIGGISTAQVGFMTRTRNLIFYDTENATVSNRLSYPFATEVVTPDCYRGWVPEGKHVPYAGYHELAYLHPDRFAPDPGILSTHGVDPQEPFTVVRFVSWKAMHDVKARGYSPEDKLLLARTLQEHGKVYITSEAALPEQFEKYRLPLPPHQVHHLLAFAQLIIGESATMASESAVLGTPFVYLDVVGRGYTDEQEGRYGLGYNFRPWQVRESVDKAEEALKGNLKDSDRFREGHSRMMAEKIDVTEFIVERLLDAGTRLR
ncbi:MAG: DUF354 domain-containing protein [bacterium]|nr:DUF354 domain-containing protein [bacterium]